MRLPFTSFVLAAAAATTLAVSAGAEARGRFLSPAERGIASDVLLLHSDVRDLGPMRAGATIKVGLVLKYQHENELEALTLAQGNRRSPYYHRYLTPAQWTAYFAPSPQTYARTIATLQRSGFHIDQIFKTRGMIRASATAASAGRFFHTQFHSVSQLRRGLRYVNTTAGSLPAELRDVVVSVAGLHDVVGMHFPIAFTKRPHRVSRYADRRRSAEPVVAVAATATPKPITTSTPAAPGSEASETPIAPLTDQMNTGGYGPPTFADAYDFPIQHGYGGKGHKTASVIDSDFADEDQTLETSYYKIPRTGTATRVCTDPNGACTICNDSTTATEAATCDPEGESSLDAETIMALAPNANFYEYLVNSDTSLDDLNVDGAYESVVAGLPDGTVVDAVNSSFGECETDDPSALYSANYIAMEGAAEGIMFSASAGDTGGTSCGVYGGNGAPQTEVNVSFPASAPYFTSVGGTTFQEIDKAKGCTGTGSACYTNEIGWANGGGGVSVYEPQPSWQATLVADGTTTPTGMKSVPAPNSGRDVPDVSFVADPNAGVGEAITWYGFSAGGAPNASETSATGGTSLASPVWVAMQVDINEVQGSLNGFVNPRLYAIAAYGGPNAAGKIVGAPAAVANAEYAFAYRDILEGDNVPYMNGPGYDLVTGIGSVLGWELAGTE